MEKHGSSSNERPRFVTINDAPPRRVSTTPRDGFCCWFMDHVMGTGQLHCKFSASLLRYFCHNPRRGIRVNKLSIVGGDSSSASENFRGMSLGYIFVNRASPRKFKRSWTLDFRAFARDLTMWNEMSRIYSCNISHLTNSLHAPSM